MIIKTESKTVGQLFYFNGAVEIVENQLSRLSPFESCILLVMINMVGTHEDIQTDHLKSINFDSGWNGQAVAVAAQDDTLYEKLGPGVHMVETMNYGDLGVLDGHHRLIKAEQENLFYIVVQLFPLIHPGLIIDTWLENFTPLTPQAVRDCFRDKKDNTRSKATKFQIRGSNGLVMPIKEFQPVVKVKRDLLIA